MVLRVRQAMIVPHSVQGGANGCHVATHLGSNRDLGMQCTGMDKTKGGIENGNMIAGWHRAASESSMSSLDSLAPGEPIYSQSDIPPSAYHRRARLGLHASESDDEPMTDSMQEDLVNRKFRRPLGGGGTVPLSHLAAPPAADEVAADHGYNPSDDGKDCTSRVKFMCSFGGKIFPRPLDGKLRYVGGDTKIISVSRDTNFAELMAKMTDVYGQAPTLKYQLPDEDLDALVSVSSDEDLENMLEEYDRLVRADVSSKLRVFLFPAVDYDSSSSLHLKESTADSRNSEQRYVDAVNGISEAGPRIRMENFGNNAPVFPTENLIGVDMPEAWNFQARGQDAVPVPLVSPPIAHDVVSQNLRLTAAPPVSGLPSKPTAPSAPSSAPSSPPLLPRTAPLGKPFVGADLHLPYHHDTHGKVVPQYKEGNYQESENHGGSAASSAASQHDALYRSSESWRPPDSPPRKPPHDVGHPVDYALRMEQQRRLSEPKMSRVGSHGKLSRLADHGELASEAQEKLETQRLIQEKALHQVVWQHPLDPQPDSFRRLDMIQPSSAQATAGLGQPQQGYQQQGYQPQPQPQQHQHVKYRGGHPPGKLLGHEGGYRQGDQQQQYAEEVLHHLPRVVSSHAMPAVSGQSNTYPVGSDPSSPRLGFRDAPSSKHVPGSQQLPLHWAYSGAAFAEQPAYGRRKPTVDQPGRSYRVSNSPPKYRDHLIHNDERLHRQQQGLGSSESLHHDQVPKSAQFYETGSAGQPYDLLSRPHIPQYKGLNPFQEKIVPYQDHQESGDGRRHQLSIQGKDSQGLTVHQPQHLQPLHQNQRHDYHDPLPHQGDQLSVNSRYQEPLKIAEWDSEDARLAFRGRPRAVAADDERHVDSGTSHEREMHQATYSGLHLPETSEDLLSGQVADFPLVHGNNERLDHSGNGFPFRPTVLPPAAGIYSNPKPRSAHSDTLGIPRYVSRPNESDYLAGGMRTTGSNLDPRPSIFEVNGQQQIVQPPSGPHRLDERTAAFSPVTQQLKTLRLGDNVMMGNDIRWNGGLGPDDVRIEVANQGPSRDNMGAYYEDRHPGLPNVPVSRGRLSRPSSSSNIAGLVDDERGDSAHLLPYGTTQGRNGLLMDEDVVIHQYPGQSHSSTENLLYISNPTRPANPTPSVNSVPYAAGKLSFDRSPPGSTSADFLATMDDLPAIKTIATQVPSIEGDNSGGSTSTVGGSYQNLSNKGSGELCMGQMAMAQHLAEDVASCVLDTSPVKMDSDPGMVPCDTVAAQGTTGWPREPPPSSSPNPWENALDDAVATKNEEINDTSLLADENSDSTPVEAASSTSKQEVHEDAKVSITEVDKDKGKVKNAADVAAADAIAHGLQTIKNDDLEELRELGSGTFGTVYHGKWRGTDVAIKRIKASCFAGRPSEQERLVADFWREACNLGHLHHPNVVAFYGVVSDGPGGTLATVTEYMVNGSLKQVLQKKDRTIDRRKRLLIAMDSAFGMEYLHGKNIVHFDLKCENLLVNMRDPHRPICKVGDLGLSKVKHQTMVSGGVRGTLPWMAPELLDGSSSLVTEKVDVFSFGIVMWELLTGEEPYANMHYGAIIGGIVNHTLRPPIPTWCDPGWRSLMERCWSSDTNARPSFSVIASELRAMSEGLKLKPQPPPVQV